MANEKGTIYQPLVLTYFKNFINWPKNLLSDIFTSNADNWSIWPKKVSKSLMRALKCATSSLGPSNFVFFNSVNRFCIGTNSLFLRSLMIFLATDHISCSARKNSFLSPSLFCLLISPQLINSRRLMLTFPLDSLISSITVSVSRPSLLAVGGRGFGPLSVVFPRMCLCYPKFVRIPFVRLSIS